MRSIAVINQKGGCGKTTISINLAACLALQGKRTLLIDMDPQSHCAVGLAVPEDQIDQTIYDVLIGPHRQKPIPLKDIIWQIASNFDFAPSGIDLAAFEQQMAGVPGRENCLRGVLAQVGEEYAFAVIDCPPSIGLLTFNALRAADEVIVPVDTGFFSVHALSKQLQTLEVLRKQCRQEIKLRVLANQYDVRTKLAREVLSELRKKHGGVLMKTVINFNTKLKEAASFGQPITEYDPSSRGFRDFRDLAGELLAQAAAEPRAVLEEASHRIDEISRSAEQLLARSRELLGERPVSRRPQRVETRLEQAYGVKQNGPYVEFVAECPNAQRVCIAGDFNGWQPDATPMTRTERDGVWHARLNLPPGRYRYRLVVDGTWQQDPHNSYVEANPFGELNSVVEVT